MSLAETMSAADADSSARQKLAECIAGLDAAKRLEAATAEAQGAAREIEADARRVLADRSAALQASGVSLAAQLVKAARDGAAGPTTALTATDEDAAQASLLTGRLSAASAAVAQLDAELATAKQGVIAAQYAADLAVQAVVMARAGVLIAEGMRLQARLAGIKDTIWAIDRVAGVIRPGHGYTPPPIPPDGVRLLFQHEPAQDQVEAVKARWRAFHMALRDDPDAAPPPA